jgi:hypothetical protein
VCVSVCVRACAELPPPCLQRLPMLSLCCRPSSPSALPATCLPARLTCRAAVRDRGDVGLDYFLLSLPPLCYLCIFCLCCALCDSPPAVLSVLCLYLLHALNCRYQLSALRLALQLHLPLTGALCLAITAVKGSSSCFSGSCTGCSRPHVDYAISIVSAPCRVSESFCVSAPNIRSTSLRV